MSNLKKLLAQAAQQTAQQTKPVQYGLADKLVTDDDLHRAMYNLGDALLNGSPKDDVTLRKLDLFSALLGPRGRGSGKISPSEACDDSQWCGRKFYLDLARFPADVNYVNELDNDQRMTRLFDLGTMVHWYIQAVLHRAGILSGAEVRAYDPARGTDGSADGVVKIKVPLAPNDPMDTREQDAQALLEIKTMTTYQFGKLQAPVQKQVRQASIYADALGLEWILMFYYDKNNSDIKTWVVKPDEEFLTRYRTMAEGLVKRLASNNRRHRSKDARTHADLPPRYCADLNSPRAKTCPYALQCFADLPTT